MVQHATQQVSGQGRRDLEVNVFRPEDASSHGVAAILIHGGGWAHGHRSMTHGYAQALAKAGFVAIAAEYRLIPEAPWPSQLDDVRDIVRWTKENAAGLGVDAEKIALVGLSAGGHLALLVGGTQPGSGHETAIGADAAGTGVAAVVSFFSPVNLNRDAAARDRPPYSAIVNGGGEAAARAVSPVNYVHPNFPSTFIIGGMADYMQPLENGLEMLHAMVQCGAEVEFHYLHSQPHEFVSVPGMLGPVMDEVAFYLVRTLVEREEIRREAQEHNIFARAASPEEFLKLVGQQ